MVHDLPLALIEVVLTFGALLAFGWWQLRELRHDQERSRRERAQREATASHSATEVSDATR